jgi:hypothetical protein
MWASASVLNTYEWENIISKVFMVKINDERLTFMQFFTHSITLPMPTVNVEMMAAASGRTPLATTV